MSVYLSGPMSGIQSFNIPAFDAAANRLRQYGGYKVVSPAELDAPQFRKVCIESDGTKDNLERRCSRAGITPESWGSLLARDVKLLADGDVDAVAVLPGWKHSKGALLETFVARLLGLLVYEYRDKDRPMLRRIDQRILYEAHSHLGYATLAVAPVIDLEAFPPITARETSSSSKTNSEVRVVDSDTGGEKGEKPEAFDLLPWPALAEVAKVYAFGAKKYQPNNWRKGFRWGLCFASKLRHLTAFWSGQSIDPETKCHHLASDVFHSLTLMEFERNELGKDDRAVH